MIRPRLRAGRTEEAGALQSRPPEYTRLRSIEGGFTCATGTAAPGSLPFPARRGGRIRPRGKAPPPWLPCRRKNAGMIIDTDIGGDPDDAIALAAAARCAPSLSLVATSDETGPGHRPGLGLPARRPSEQLVRPLLPRHHAARRPGAQRGPGPALRLLHPRAPVRRPDRAHHRRRRRAARPGQHFGGVRRLHVLAPRGALPLGRPLPGPGRRTGGPRSRTSPGRGPAGPVSGPARRGRGTRGRAGSRRRCAR